MTYVLIEANHKRAMKDFRSFIILFIFACNGHHLIILCLSSFFVFVCTVLSLCSSPPPLTPFLHFQVPKKLLKEQGHRPPGFSPPPSAHDPNIVGDSPPEGSSVKSPSAVPGEDISFLTLSHTQAHTHGPPSGEQVAIISPQPLEHQEKESFSSHIYKYNISQGI